MGFRYVGVRAAVGVLELGASATATATLQRLWHSSRPFRFGDLGVDLALYAEESVVPLPSTIWAFVVPMGHVVVLSAVAFPDHVAELSFCGEEVGQAPDEHVGLRAGCLR